jgi:hypothetical protein
MGKASPSAAVSGPEIGEDVLDAAEELGRSEEVVEDSIAEGDTIAEGVV